MPSPITTSGFQVTARPGIDYVDPRLMAPAYDKVIPSISQGLGTVGQFAQIMDEAKMSPLRRRLAQIQIQDAEARLSLAPIEEQMAVARLQEAQQNAAVPHVLADTVELSGGERRLAPRNLDAGFGNIQFDESYTPRVRTTTGREIGAGGVISPFEKRETLATAGQVGAEIAKQASDLDYKLSLSEARLANAKTAAEAAQAKAETDRLRAENDAIKADAMRERARIALEDPKWKTVSAGQDAAGNLVINQVNAAGELRTIPTGEKKSASNFFFGGVNLSTAPVASASGAASPARNAIDADIAALAGLATGGTPAKVETLTVEQARVAPVGTVFLGIDGKKRKKNADGTVSLIAN